MKFHLGNCPKQVLVTSSAMLDAANRIAQAKIAFSSALETRKDLGALLEATDAKDKAEHDLVKAYKEGLVL